MTRLEDLNQASKLAFAHMKPGALTNHVMTAAEYKSDIAAGTLYAHTWPGGLIFLRKREGHHQLSYFVTDPQIPLDCKLPEDTFTEIAYKPSGAEIAAKGIEYWMQVGLKPIFERIRLTRQATPEKNNDNPETPHVGRDAQAAWASSKRAFCVCGQPQDAQTIHNLLKSSFSHLTGHLPDYHELKTDITENNILCMKDPQNTIIGLIRSTPRKASIEIRQLALREDMRGRGLAHHLMNAFIEKYGNNKITVWMQDGYAPALKSYTAAGFVPDGWRSSVLTF